MSRRRRHRSAAADRRGAFCLAVALAAVLSAGGSAAVAGTCTRELNENEFAGREIPEISCEGVIARLRSLQSEMYYRRWSGEIEVRALGGERDVKIALAAFDAAGNLVGTASFYRRGVDRKRKTIPFRVDGMFTSLADTKKILVSISMPSRRGEEAGSR